jgi:hypothetical protein
VADGDGLENHCGSNVTVGSNPTPSALSRYSRLTKQPVLAARALQGRHGTLVLARPQPLVARVLEITGADKLLEVRES